MKNDVKHAPHPRMRVLATVFVVAAGADSAWAQSRERAFLEGVSLTLQSGSDGLRDDSRVEVVVRLRSGVVRAIPIPVIGDDARNAEIHYDNLGEPSSFRVGPVAQIDALGLRFHQGRGGFPEHPDNFTITFLSISLTGESQSYAWEVSTTSSLPHRFRGNEDYFPGGLSVVARPILCGANEDCDDGTFCKGVERCIPNDPNADARGCVTTPACDPKDLCSELERACVPAGCETPDRDGDGVRRRECGGTDCDDEDDSRFPGNPEICDVEHHDEDCDPGTLGHRDLDGDGHSDGRCCNTQFDGSLRCGSDCDDFNPGIVPSAQVCGSQGTVLVCRPDGAYEVSACASPGDFCMPQPNGLGICMPDPCACKVQ